MESTIDVYGKVGTGFEPVLKAFVDNFGLAPLIDPHHRRLGAVVRLGW